MKSSRAERLAGMSRKVTTIIVISVVALFAVVLTLVSLVSYRIFFDFTSREISETRLALLNENTDKLSGISRNISDAGYYLAGNEKIIQIFSEPVLDAFDAITEQRELRDQLTIMKGLKPKIHSLGIYTDRYSNYSQFTDGTVDTIDKLAQQPWFSMFDEMDSGWVPWEENGRSMVSFVHRLVDYKGSKVGYVMINVTEDSFFSDLSAADHLDPSRDLLLIVDTGGRVLARTQVEGSQELIELLAYKNEEMPFYRLRDEYELLADHHELLVHDTDRYLLLISARNYDRWRLVQVIPIDPLYEETRRLGTLVLILGVAALLLSVPLVYWLGNRIILRPIRKIIQGMKQVERGNFKVQVEPLYVEEFDHLANRFNHMAGELQRLIEQIERAHWERRDAEMKMLQTQIMPHFLYNTLDIIHWKAMDYHAEEISLMVNALSKMFRIGLSGGRHFIRLHDELEHVKCYIDIQRARMANREIRYEVNVPGSLKECFVPKIILQPFIENSMKHGYANRPDEPVRISVDAALDEEGGRLIIRIADQGEGLPEGWSLERTAGIGMRNVQERIWMYCGRAYGITARRRAEGGTEIVIELPVLRTQEEADASLEMRSERLGQDMRDLT